MKYAGNAQLVESTILHAPLQLRGCKSDIDATDLITKVRTKFHTVHGTASTSYTPSPPRREGQEDDSFIFDTLGIQESETLRGVHIAGFNYVFTPNHRPGRMDISGDDSGDTSDQEQSTPLSADSETLENIPAALAGESIYVTPAGSAHSTVAGSGASASTALYSCTSFGELREALEARPSEKFPLPTPTCEDDDFQSNIADPAAVGASRGRMASRRSSTITELSHLRPTSILLRNNSRAMSIEPELDLGARGLGLRKYASLDFDLDTVVSLEPDLATSRAHATSGAQAIDADKPAPPSRRVSFADATASPADTIVPPASTLTDGTPTPWKHLSKYYSPTPNVNKLRKKRNESMPLLETPRLLEKVNLPDGVEQIGLGIGYTRSRPPRAGPSQGKSQTPRTRAVSVGSSVARCGALLSQIRRTKTSGTQETNDQKQPERASEESDAMESVMREMYGAAWNSELGVGYLGGATDQAVSSRRKAGRVYSVDADSEGLIGSTLRLVQTPNMLEAHVQ
ncbi:uncharacterized protein PHACADRAFT_167918 [Phanerochaete carnosa HHB-10118-sp]|uniref:Uncharacterized protein n=1 Tax=Phanerochaete carnosa (strain HHB-10118-sp) TaxID=650164 RepID=K5WMY3_PHACS|nr:uncharacterized protein PHACADRAFT_167918 [Phanerochaete carnosa HHB-10118-sp]EKM60579.1 hypothetical protein PHACADRAFT_167918 [Phanerochaete carnosa HHB-10118-sp]